MCLHRCHAKGKKFLHPNRWLHSCYKKLTMQFIFFAVTAHCQVTFSLLSTRILSPFLQRPLLSRVLSHRIAHHSCTALHLLFLNFIIFLPLEFYEVTLRTSFNAQYISRSPSWYHQWISCACSRPSSRGTIKTLHSSGLSINPWGMPGAIG